MLPCAHPAAALEEVFPARDYVSGETFSIVRCRACGLALTHPLLDLRDGYYPAGYFGDPGRRRFPALVERFQDELYAARARAVERALGVGIETRRVLDVGCGRGYQLRAFARRGWETLGTEATEAAAAHARDSLGLRVEIGELQALGLPAGGFDAVVLWHVLEHVSQAAPLLGEVARVLRPGGVALIAVPNFASWEARWSRSHWFHLDVPRHVSHWTPEVLRAALAEAGLEVEWREFLSPEYDVFSFVQSALNRLGLRHNLLYDAVRGEGAKVLRSGLSLETAVSVALAGPLAVVGVPATLVAGWMGRGATVSLIARKVERGA